MQMQGDRHTETVAGPLSYDRGIAIYFYPAPARIRRSGYRGDASPSRIMPLDIRERFDPSFAARGSGDSVPLGASPVTEVNRLGSSGGWTSRIDVTQPSGVERCGWKETIRGVR
ncbi:hypothetical protein KM043_018023 [Ampulex compressa]|nr:hypothetical protein KM043_018023 [Ampulex compressa]